MLAKDAMKDVQLMMIMMMKALYHLRATLTKLGRQILHIIKSKQRIVNAWKTSYTRRRQLLDNFWLTKFGKPEKLRRNFAVRLDGSSFRESNNYLKNLQ